MPAAVPPAEAAPAHPCFVPAAPGAAPAAEAAAVPTAAKARTAPSALPAPAPGPMGWAWRSTMKADRSSGEPPMTEM